MAEKPLPIGSEPGCPYGLSFRFALAKEAVL